jgi:argininosuccinate synthase
VLVDVGRAFDIDASIERGQAAGAADVLLIDRRAEFASDQVAKALKTNALYEGRYPLVSALSRPVIAGAVADIAVPPEESRPRTAPGPSSIHGAIRAARARLEAF